MRVLVTGGNGFVGRYLVAALRERGDEVFSAGHARANSDQTTIPLDLADRDNVRAAVDISRPDLVFHLAAQSSVREATVNPFDTYDTNILGTARLLEAVRAVRDDGGNDPRVLLTSSAEVYGKAAALYRQLGEDALPAPMTPYAASKLGAEAIALAASATYGMDLIVTRAFNHIGPGQDARFVVPAFARQLAEIVAGGKPILSVGNLESERDFLDVRDVVDAYLALAERGVSGEAYNVCSGSGVKIKEVLRRLISLAHIPVEVREDPERMRKVEVSSMVGDNAKLKAATGWAPRYTLDQSLRDILEDAKQQLAAER